MLGVRGMPCQSTACPTGGVGPRRLEIAVPRRLARDLQTFESTAQVSHDILGKGHDLFADGSVVLFPFPATQPASMACCKPRKARLLVADAFWDIRAVTEGLVPNPIVRVFLRT